MTLAIGVAAFFGVRAAVQSQRRLALIIFGTVVFWAGLLGLGRFIGPIFQGLYYLEWEGLFPPAWPYSLAMPLLLLLLFELALPNRRAGAGPMLPTLLVLVAAVAQLFFSVSMLGVVADWSELFTQPSRLLMSHAAALGMSACLVLGAVLGRKGYVPLGAAMLVGLAGVLIAGATWLYDTPHFVFSIAERAPNVFPLLPVLAGTIPGVLVSLAAAGMVMGARRP